MKLFKFGFSIIWLVIGIVLSVCCYMFNQSMLTDNRLGLIFLIPVYIVLTIINYSTTAGAVFGFGLSLNSMSKVIKIMSIIFFIISLALLGFCVYNTINFIKVL